MKCVLLCDCNQVVVQSTGDSFRIFKADIIGLPILQFMTPIVAELHTKLFRQKRIPKAERFKSFHMSNAQRFVLLDIHKHPMMCDVLVNIQTDFSCTLCIQVVHEQMTLFDTIPRKYQRYLGRNKNDMMIDEYNAVTCVFMDLYGTYPFMKKHGNHEMACVYQKLYNITMKHIIELYPFVYVHELVGDTIFMVVNAPFMITHPHGNSAQLAFDVAKEIQTNADTSILTPYDMYLRVGIAVGPVTGGVIDGRTFRLFGSVVHLTQRLESICPKGRIVVNDEIAKNLRCEMTQAHDVLKGFGEVTYYIC